jgi:hypothetical protein
VLIFFLDENDEFNLNGFAFEEKEFLDFGFLDLEKDLFVIPVDNGDNGVLTWNKLLLCNKLVLYIKLHFFLHNIYYYIYLN